MKKVLATLVVCLLALVALVDSNVYGIKASAKEKVKLGRVEITDAGVENYCPQLKWKAVENATSYEVWRRFGTNGEFVYVGTTEKTEWEDYRAPRKIAWQYDVYYQVRAVYTSDDSSVLKYGKFSKTKKIKLDVEKLQLTVRGIVGDKVATCKFATNMRLDYGLLGIKFKELEIKNEDGLAEYKVGSGTDADIIRVYYDIECLSSAEYKRDAERAMYSAPDIMYMQTSGDVVQYVIYYGITNSASARISVLLKKKKASAEDNTDMYVLTAHVQAAGKYKEEIGSIIEAVVPRIYPVGGPDDAKIIFEELN